MQIRAGIAIAIAASANASETKPDVMSYVVTVKVPQGIEARSTALVIAGTAGWTTEHEARARRLAQLHTLVIAINGAAMAADLAGACDQSAPLLADIAQQIQHREGALARLPVLTALADGADIALHASAALPQNFKGLVTHSIGTASMLCTGELIPNTIGSKAPVRWLDVVEPGKASPAGHLAGTKIVPAKAGQRKAYYRSYLGVAGTDPAFDLRTSTKSEPLQDLPLTIHLDSKAPRTDTYAIFLSGDGGWANFDEEVSEHLAANGIPVVGISSLRYLWQEKSPARIARDFTRIDEHYRAAFNRKKVLLVGFSLGANTLPFVTAELPDDLRQRLTGLGLIAPETRTGFEIVIGGWFGQQTGSVEVVPGIDALARYLDPNRVACLHGHDEKLSACPLVSLEDAQTLGFKGGHHLGNDHAGIADALIELIQPNS